MSHRDPNQGISRRPHVLRYEIRAANHGDEAETSVGWTDSIHRARGIRDHAKHDYPDGIVLIVDHDTDCAVA